MKDVNKQDLLKRIEQVETDIGLLTDKIAELKAITDKIAESKAIVEIADPENKPELISRSDLREIIEGHLSEMKKMYESIDGYWWDAGSYTGLFHWVFNIRTCDRTRIIGSRLNEKNLDDRYWEVFIDVDERINVAEIHCDKIVYLISMDDIDEFFHDALIKIFEDVDEYLKRICEEDKYDSINKTAENRYMLL